MTDSIIKIQSLFKGYSFRKRILIPPSSYQTKLWRQKQKWYRGGKHNECELYQRDLIEKITKLPCNKSDKRFNIYNKLHKLWRTYYKYRVNIGGVIYEEKN